MLNPFKEVDWRPDRAALRRFARSLMIGFPTIAVLFLAAGWLRKGTVDMTVPAMIGGIGFALGLILFLIPSIARPFYVVWYAIGCLFGLVIGNVIFTLIFIVVVTGIGTLKKLFGKSAIRKGFDRSAPSYWQDARQTPDELRYFRQF